MSYTEFSTSLLVSVLGFAMWPHLFMKAYTAESERVIKKTIMMYTADEIPRVGIPLSPVGGHHVGMRRSLQPRAHGHG